MIMLNSIYTYTFSFISFALFFLFPGHYLFVEMAEGAEEIHVWSPKFSQTKPQCKLHVDLKMVNMTAGNFKVVIETTNDTSWVVDEKMGNNRNK